MMEMFNDLKVLGKREVSSIMKWRSKIAHIAHVQNQKTLKQERKMSESAALIDHPIEEENSSEQLEMQVLHEKKKEIRMLRDKEEKKQELMLRAELVNEQHNNDDQELG